MNYMNANKKPAGFHHPAFCLCKRGILSELLINACRSLTNFNEIILLIIAKIYNYFA